MSHTSLVSRMKGRAKADSVTRARPARSASVAGQGASVQGAATPASAPLGVEPLYLTSRQICDEIVGSLGRKGCPWG